MPREPEVHSRTFRVFGVTLTARAATAELLAAAEGTLPPGSRPGEPADAIAAVELAGAEDLDRFDAELRRLVATHAPAHVFVHAGVVARGDRALVLPATTFAGKSELVAALVRAGADYLSDEYAVLGADGLVHPYARRISLRGRGEVSAEELGGRTVTAPLPVAVIAATRYEPGATFAPERRTAAAGALLLLEHAGQALDAPDRALQAVHAAAEGTAVLVGPRGEAEPAARALLAELAR